MKVQSITSQKVHYVYNVYYVYNICLQNTLSYYQIHEFQNQHLAPSSGYLPVGGSVAPPRWCGSPQLDA